MYYINTHRHASSWCAPACVHNRQGPSCWNTDILYLYDIYILCEYTSSRPLLSVYQRGCTTVRGPLDGTHIHCLYMKYIYVIRIHIVTPLLGSHRRVCTTVRGPLVGTQIYYMYMMYTLYEYTSARPCGVCTSVGAQPSGALQLEHKYIAYL